MEPTRFDGFTDIHSHLLPGVDDGAKDLEQSRELLQMAWDYGTRTIFLTPHYRGPYKKNTPEMLRSAYRDLCQMAAEAFPGMRLYLGNEVHYQSDVPDRLTDGRILTMADSQYVLLEFQTRALRSQVVTAVAETARYGYTPIIAHAERYDIFRKEPSLVEDVMRYGALIQLNADSVLGKHGWGVKWFCHKVLKARNAHFIASDAHDSQHRTPLLRECFLRVHKKYGAEYAVQVFFHNAQAVIEDRTI